MRCDLCFLLWNEPQSTVLREPNNSKNESIIIYYSCSRWNLQAFPIQDTILKQSLGKLDLSCNQPWLWKSCLDKRLLWMVCSHCWKVGTLVFLFSRFQMCAANIRATPRSNQQKWQRHEFNVEVLDLQCGYQHYSRLPAWLQNLHPLLCCDFKTPNLSQSNLPGQNWPLQSSAVPARFAGQGSGADTMNAIIYCWTEDVTQLLDDVLFQNRQPKVFCSWPHWTCRPGSLSANRVDFLKCINAIWLRMK